MKKKKKGGKHIYICMHELAWKVANVCDEVNAMETYIFNWELVSGGWTEWNKYWFFSFDVACFSRSVSPLSDLAGLFWSCFDKSVYGLSCFDKFSLSVLVVLFWSCLFWQVYLWSFLFWQIYFLVCFGRLFLVLLVLTSLFMVFLVLTNQFLVLHVLTSLFFIMLVRKNVFWYLNSLFDFLIFLSLTLNCVVILSALTESEEQEIKVLTKLKETVDKQREELRVVKRDLSQKAIDCEAVSMWLGCSGDLQLCGFTYVISHKHFSLRASRFKDGCNVKLLCVLKSDCFIVGWRRASVHMCSNWHAGLASFLPLTLGIDPWQLKVKEQRKFPGCLGQRWHYFCLTSQSVSQHIFSIAFIVIR